MGCEEIRDLLALYAGGESYDNERAAVEAHVAVCAACARDLDQYREMRSNLAQLREGGAPPGTFKSLWPGVRADLFPHKPARTLAWFDAVLRYAAVVMVGIAIGVIVHYGQRREAAPPPPAKSLASAPELIPAPVSPATLPTRTFAVPRPRPAPPKLESDPGYYLPRVELIPAGRDKDY